MPKEREASLDEVVKEDVVKEKSLDDVVLDDVVKEVSLDEVVKEASLDEVVKEEAIKDNVPAEQKDLARLPKSKVTSFIDAAAWGKHVTVSKIDIIYTMVRTPDDYDECIKALMEAIKQNYVGFTSNTIAIDEHNLRGKYPAKAARAWNAMSIILSYNVMGLRVPFTEAGFKSMFVEEYRELGDKLAKMISVASSK